MPYADDVGHCPNSFLTDSTSFGDGLGLGGGFLASSFLARRSFGLGPEYPDLRCLACPLMTWWSPLLVPTHPHLPLCIYPQQVPNPPLHSVEGHARYPLVETKSSQEAPEGSNGEVCSPFHRSRSIPPLWAVFSCLCMIIASYFRVSTVVHVSPLHIVK